MFVRVIITPLVFMLISRSYLEDLSENQKRLYRVFFDQQWL